MSYKPLLMSPDPQWHFHIWSSLFSFYVTKSAFLLSTCDAKYLLHHQEMINQILWKVLHECTGQYFYISGFWLSYHGHKSWWEKIAKECVFCFFFLLFHNGIFSPSVLCLIQLLLTVCLCLSSFSVSPLCYFPWWTISSSCWTFPDCLTRLTFSQLKQQSC